MSLPSREGEGGGAPTLVGRPRWRTRSSPGSGPVRGFLSAAPGTVRREREPCVDGHRHSTASLGTAGEAIRTLQEGNVTDGRIAGDGDRISATTAAGGGSREGCARRALDAHPAATSSGAAQVCSPPARTSDWISRVRGHGPAGRRALRVGPWCATRPSAASPPGPHLYGASGPQTAAKTGVSDASP